MSAARKRHITLADRYSTAMLNTTPNPLLWIDAELDTLERQGLRRRLAARGSPQGARLTLDGRELINFGSNDYLAWPPIPGWRRPSPGPSPKKAGAAGPARW